MSKLVKKVQTHHQRTTCRKKKGIVKETIVKESKNLIDKVLSYIVTTSHPSDATTLSEVLEECGVTAEQYDNALGFVEK